MEAQTAPECDTKKSDLVGSTQHLGSCQQRRLVVELVVVSEQYRYGGIGGVALVDDGCARDVRARHHVARLQLWDPAAGVGRQCVATQHRGAQAGIAEQGFHIRVNLNYGIALAIGLVVDGCRGQVDDTGCRCDEFRDQVVGKGGVEQWPDQKDGVDADERGAQGGGVCEVADRPLDSGMRSGSITHKASYVRAVGLEAVNDLTAEVAGRAGDQYRWTAGEARGASGSGMIETLGVQVDMKARRVP